VFTAVRMQLEGLRQSLVPAAETRLDRLLSLVDAGIRSIRNVTNDLRPSLLDDLGLLPALRSLASDFAERTGHRVTVHAPTSLPQLPAEAELALYRALQEALSNVARHAQARTVDVRLTLMDNTLQMRVADDGIGLSASRDKLDAREGMGLTGMRERIHAIGGQVVVLPSSTEVPGAEVRVTVPMT
jgi:signal transduction histidine kinase